MKRRSFLKFFGGVAAAPAVVKPTIPLTASPLTGAMMGQHLVSEVGEAATPILGEFDKLERLQQIRRLLLGKEKQREPTWSAVIRMTQFEESRLNNLRSVSQSAKLRMLARSVRMYREQEQRVDLHEEYNRLKKQLFKV